MVPHIYARRNYHNVFLANRTSVLVAFPVFLEQCVPEEVHESCAQLNFLATAEEEEKEGVTRNREGRESFGILGCQLDARSLIPRLSVRPSEEWEERFGGQGEECTLRRTTE